LEIIFKNEAWQYVRLTLAFCDLETFGFLLQAAQQDSP
jgi:hypothetical protein